jgi:hypothetical protein
MMDVCDKKERQLMCSNVARNGYAKGHYYLPIKLQAAGVIIAS